MIPFVIVQKESGPKIPSYSFMKFIGDALATFITGGFWVFWILVRESRYIAQGGRK